MTKKRPYRLIIGAALAIGLGWTVGHITGQMTGQTTGQTTGQLGAVSERAPERTVASVERARHLQPGAMRPADEAPVLLASTEALSPGALAMHPEPEEQFVERPAGEWRGMLVNEAWTWACDADTPCSNARACIDNQCLACRADADCLSGEACVLDHCVQREAMACSSYTDCDDGALCALSGLTHGARRGNEDMRAYCLAPTGGSEFLDEVMEATESPASVESPTATAAMAAMNL